MKQGFQTKSKHFICYNFHISKWFVEITDNEVRILTRNCTCIYFLDRLPNSDSQHVIHLINCPYLAKELDRVYIGLAPSPPAALQRAEKTFSPKSFVLCPKCCNEAKFIKKNN